MQETRETLESIAEELRRLRDHCGEQASNRSLTEAGRMLHRGGYQAYHDAYHKLATFLDSLPTESAESSR